VSVVEWEGVYVCVWLVCVVLVCAWYVCVFFLDGVWSMRVYVCGKEVCVCACVC